MMIFLAGLQGIPRDQYEAASVDGAAKFKQFLYITLPGLKGTIKYVIMITMIQAMKLFTQPYIMTQGGPKNSIKTLVYYIYSEGFQRGRLWFRFPRLFMVFILDFVAHWNDFMWPFLVMTGENKRTIQLAVQSFFGTQPVHYGAIMAALVVSAEDCFCFSATANTLAG